MRRRISRRAWDSAESRRQIALVDCGGYGMYYTQIHESDASYLVGGLDGLTTTPRP